MAKHARHAAPTSAPEQGGAPDQASIADSAPIAEHEEGKAPAAAHAAVSPTPVLHQEPRKSRKGLVAALIIILVLVIVAGAIVAILVLRPPFAAGILEALGFSSEAPAQTQSESFTDINDQSPSAEERATIDAEAKEAARTPIIAQCNGIDLHSPITMADLTGILFHQSETPWALIMSTDLPEADYDRVTEDRTMRINHEQQGSAGAWADTEALHLWRDDAEMDMDTAVDVGALAGTTVVAPVSGTVILIRNYTLEDDIDDIEIHIQPDGRPDLDVVLIHTVDSLVKAGDRVEAGITPISHVRDIEKDLADVQLGFYTPEGVGGNHTHVQVNDVNYENYRESRLSGAIKVN